MSTFCGRCLSCGSVCCWLLLSFSAWLDSKHIYSHIDTRTLSHTQCWLVKMAICGQVVGHCVLFAKARERVQQRLLWLSASCLNVVVAYCCILAGAVARLLSVTWCPSFCLFRLSVCPSFRSCPVAYRAFNIKKMKKNARWTCVYLKVWVCPGLHSPVSPTVSSLYLCRCYLCRYLSLPAWLILHVYVCVRLCVCVALKTFSL